MFLSKQISILSNDQVMSGFLLSEINFHQTSILCGAMGIVYVLTNRHLTPYKELHQRVQWAVDNLDLESHLALNFVKRRTTAELLLLLERWVQFSSSSLSLSNELCGNFYMKHPPSYCARATTHKNGSLLESWMTIARDTMWDFFVLCELYVLVTNQDFYSPLAYSIFYTKLDSLFLLPLLL